MVMLDVGNTEEKSLNIASLLANTVDLGKQFPRVPE